MRQYSEQQRCRQTISIPFLWEEKPGKPKKDWKPETQLAIVPVQPPPKLAVSIPFIWEEKPGKPWDFFSQHHSDSPNKKQLIMSSSSCSSPLSTPSSEEEEKTSNDCFYTDTDDCFSQSDFEVFSININHSPVKDIVPYNQSPENYPSKLVQIPNWEHGPFSNQLQVVAKKSEDTPSLTGENGGCFPSSVIEFLFPLLAPKPGNFLYNVSHQYREASTTDEDHSNNCREIGKRAPTLGELMMMSRRLSYATNVAPLKKRTHIMVRSYHLVLSL